MVSVGKTVVLTLFFLYFQCWIKNRNIRATKSFCPGMRHSFFPSFPTSQLPLSPVAVRSKIWTHGLFKWVIHLPISANSLLFVFTMSYRIYWTQEQEKWFLAAHSRSSPNYIYQKCAGNLIHWQEKWKGGDPRGEKRQFRFTDHLPHEESGNSSLFF